MPDDMAQEEGLLVPEPRPPAKRFPAEPSQSWQPSFHVIQHVDWSCF